MSNFDFDTLPIKAEHMRDRAKLQRMITELFVTNYNDPDTKRFGVPYAGLLYDYCAVALRKNHDCSFRIPIQTLYGGSPPFSLEKNQSVSVRSIWERSVVWTRWLGSRIVVKTRERGLAWIPGAIFRTIVRILRKLR